jgi:hypothetical protein
VIIEIGDRPFVSMSLPDETQFFSTRSGLDRPDGVRVLPGLFALWRALGDPTVRLIVVQPTFYAPWSWQHVIRAIFSRHIFRGRLPLFRVYGPQLLRWRGRAPIVVMDHEDMPVINRNSLYLLDRCRLWFKRELPVDHWRVFMKTAHANLPTPRFRLARRNRARVAKLRPISLGFKLGIELPDTAATAAKTVDVFFAGRIEGSSSVREAERAELLALREAGLIVDIPEGPLPRDEFYRRCAAAWLVWSPEGYGWDCFRHYEAPACGSVPVINLPTIRRHQPLVDGEHALFYEPRSGELTRVIVAALADKERLVAMARGGRAHVLAHHTPLALSRHMVEAGLEADRGAA